MNAWVNTNENKLGTFLGAIERIEVDLDFEPRQSLRLSMSLSKLCARIKCCIGLKGHSDM